MLSLAKDKARAWIESTVNGATDAARKLQVRAGYPTLQAIADVYIRNYGTDPRTSRTARGNVGALKTIVRHVLNLSLEQARANCLTGDLIRRYEKIREALIERDRRGFMKAQSEIRVRTTTAGYVRQAKSIFAKANMHWFSELGLPDLTEFKSQGVTQPDRPRPAQLDPLVIDDINAAAPRLAQDDPACYIAHLLFKFAGMRNGEIECARKAWLFQTPSGWKLGIKIRPAEGFQPKGKTERNIPICNFVIAEIKRYWQPSPDGDFIVPAPNKTERAKIVDRRHGDWCGQWIKDHTKISYELRRYAGYLVYQKTKSLAAVQKFLGHADAKTTLDWYFDVRDDDVPAIDLSDFAPTLRVA